VKPHHEQLSLFDDDLNRSTGRAQGDRLAHPDLGRGVGIGGVGGPAMGDPTTASESARGARDEYAEIRRRLETRVVGHGAVLDRLALTVLLHRRRLGVNRLLLTGPSGVGKTHLARTLAWAADCPHYLFDVSELTETGYRGINVPDLLREVHHASGADRARMARAVLVLDEIDKLRVTPDADAVSADKRRGVQSNLLTLLGTGTPLSFSSGLSDGELQVGTEDMLIICAGAFSDAPWQGRAPTTGALIRYGFVTELAERLTERIPLEPLGLNELEDLYWRGPDSVLNTVGWLYTECGYELSVPRDTYRYAAAAVLAGCGHGGPRSGNEWIHEAARRRLVQALKEGREAEEEIVLAPDDLRISRMADEVGPGGPGDFPGPSIVDL
jgi:hypothetical protein